jgi:hypothetical protein
MKILYRTLAITLIAAAAIALLPSAQVSADVNNELGTPRSEFLFGFFGCCDACDTCEDTCSSCY